MIINPPKKYLFVEEEEMTPTNSMKYFKVGIFNTLKRINNTIMKNNSKNKKIILTINKMIKHNNSFITEVDELDSLEIVEILNL